MFKIIKKILLLASIYLTACTTMDTPISSTDPYNPTQVELAKSNKLSAVNGAITLPLFNITWQFV